MIVTAFLAVIVSNLSVPAMAATTLPNPAIILNPALESDVLARTGGNDRVAAKAIAQQVFLRIEPAQVLKVNVDRAGDHRVAGILLSGVKFHWPLSRRGFTDEVLSIIAKAFAAAAIEEVDVRAVVPISVGRGTIVSGDNAVPSFREVFTLTAVRSESLVTLRQRLDNTIGVFWEPWFLHEQLEHPDPVTSGFFPPN